jgi:hypothetical protein
MGNVMSKKKRLSADIRELTLLLLLPKHYLMYRMANGGKSVAMVYKENQVPVKYFSREVSAAIKDFLRKDKKNRLIINRTSIRKLDGRRTVKKLYKVAKNGRTTIQTDLSINPSSKKDETTSS